MCSFSEGSVTQLQLPISIYLSIYLARQIDRQIDIGSYSYVTEPSLNEHIIIQLASLIYWYTYNYSYSYIRSYTRKLAKQLATACQNISQILLQHHAASYYRYLQTAVKGIGISIMQPCSYSQRIIADIISIINSRRQHVPGPFNALVPPVLAVVMTVQAASNVSRCDNVC